MAEVEIELVTYEFGKKKVVGVAKVKLKRHLGLVKEIQLDRNDLTVRYLLNNLAEED